MRIFIADDSELMREKLRALLVEMPEVELIGEAGDAPTAIAEIRRLKPDVSILDIRMPGGNGIQVLEAVKQLPDAPAVIMLTAFPYPQYRRICLAKGANYFLDKAQDFERLTDVLRDVQNRQRGNEIR